MHVFRGMVNHRGNLWNGSEPTLAGLVSFFIKKMSPFFYIRAEEYNCMNLMFVGVHNIGKTMLLREIRKYGKTTKKVTVSLAYKHDQKIFIMNVTATLIKYNQKLGGKYIKCVDKTIFIKFYWNTLRRWLRHIHLQENRALLNDFLNWTYFIAYMLYILYNRLWYRGSLLGLKLLFELKFCNHFY